MTKYILIRYALRPGPQIEISENDFLSLQAAYTTLQNIISSEEQFDAVARNFFDLESDLLATTLEFTYATLSDVTKNMSARRLLNRRVLNFLSAARAYMDHQRHAVKEIFGPTDSRAEQATKMFRTAHSENFGYRLMEELRNACQHRIFPVHLVIFSVQNEREKGALHSRVEIRVDVNQLKADKKFKQQVLDELIGYGETVDLRAFIRTYIEGIAKAHQYFRDNASELASQAKAVLQQYIDKYLNESKQANILALHAVQVVDSVWKDRVPLATDLCNYGEYLATQNSHFEAASVKYVSSAVITEKSESWTTGVCI